VRVASATVSAAETAEMLESVPTSPARGGKPRSPSAAARHFITSRHRSRMYGSPCSASASTSASSPLGRRSGGGAHLASPGAGSKTNENDEFDDEEDSLLDDDDDGGGRGGGGGRSGGGAGGDGGGSPPSSSSSALLRQAPQPPQPPPGTSGHYRHYGPVAAPAKSTVRRALSNLRNKTQALESKLAEERTVRVDKAAKHAVGL
jgi:hypothetical protein